jgi:transposase-like protein
MSDIKGDKSKQPPECQPEKYGRNPCPNMKETGGGFEGERYRCEICGETFFLDYDEMR